jgi:predicted lysophospholipase L1 biosynthesis ABC-type transport system permease subunit
MASKSNHTGLGIALGAALGAVAGVLAGHVAIWLGLGIAIGMAIGASFRRVEERCPECEMIHQKHESRSEELTVRR